MNIIFMGTPSFAVPALKRLIESEHNIVAVYTMPPKPAGRGQKALLSPVHSLAVSHNLSVLTPKNFKDDNDYQQFMNLKADIAVVAAYGVILPNRILEGAKHGCINIHPSKLPRWRGAAPIQHTILSGDKETSICIMQMDAGMDTGDILLEHKLKIEDVMTSSFLHDICAQIGADILPTVLSGIEAGTISAQVQSEVGVTHARKLTRVDEKIDFAKSAYLVNAQIRAFSARPGAYFTYNGETIKVIEARVDEQYQHKVESGITLDNNLMIACKTGVIQPTLLQREGRKMIYLDAFLRGFSIPKGAPLS